MCSAPPGRPALILGVVADRGSQQIQSVEVALDFVQYVLAFDFFICSGGGGLDQYIGSACVSSFASCLLLQDDEHISCQSVPVPKLTERWLLYLMDAAAALASFRFGSRHFQKITIVFVCDL
jgi:uncharacterized membrane protein YedE/YeeE